MKEEHLEDNPAQWDGVYRHVCSGDHEDIYHLWKGMTNITHKIYSRFHAIKYIRRHAFHWESGWNIPSTVIQQLRGNIRNTTYHALVTCSAAILCTMRMLRTKVLRLYLELRKNQQQKWRVLHSENIRSFSLKWILRSDKIKEDEMEKFINEGRCLFSWMLHTLVDISEELPACIITLMESVNSESRLISNRLHGVTFRKTDTFLPPSSPRWWRQ